MKRKVFCLLLTLSMVSLLFMPLVQANGDITVWLNGNQLAFDVPPMIVDGRTLVPFRGILEAMGAEVSYENEFAYGKILGRTLQIPIGLNAVMINSCTVATDVPAQIVNGRTLVPLRVVSECLGADVSWDASGRRIDISASDDGYIDWNDTLFYFGDVADDGTTANGYGTLYDLDSNAVVATGYFENNIILKGKLIYTTAENACYIGEFSPTDFGVREGHGTMHYEDGSFKIATWANGMVNGPFIKYDSSLKATISGNATNGKWDGEITVKYEDGTTEIIPFQNGKVVSNSNSNTSQAAPIIEETPQTVPSVGGSSDIPYAFVTAKYPLSLYSNDGKTFLGKLTTDKYDRDSISNQYGDYGSKYSDESIYNEYGKYGGDYGSESAFNEYASKPPIIVDSNGKFIAYLTANKYKTPGVTYVTLMYILEKYRQ